MRPAARSAENFVVLEIVHLEILLLLLPDIAASRNIPHNRPQHPFRWAQDTDQD